MKAIECEPRAGTFGRVRAVDSLTFGMPPGSIFALRGATGVGLGSRWAAFSTRRDLHSGREVGRIDVDWLRGAELRVLAERLVRADRVALVRDGFTLPDAVDRLAGNGSAGGP